MSSQSCTEEDLNYFLSNQNLLSSNNIDKDNTIEVERVSALEPIGMINHGSTCYINSVLQSLSNLTSFCTAFPSAFSEESDESKKVFNEVFKFLIEYYHSKKNLIDPKALLESLGYTPQQLSEQQDAHEFLTNLLTKLGNMDGVFYGKCSDSIQCTTCDYSSSQENTFQSITLDIPDSFEQENKNEKFSLLSLLKDLNKEEILDNPSDLWECQTCNKKTISKKKISYKDLPQVISLHLKRFRFDPTNRRRRKLSTLIDTPETISLEFLLSDPSQPSEYELSSIVCHSGTPSSGHYKSFVYNSKEKQWYECNDEKIKKLSETEKEFVFNSYVQENSYILFYTKKNIQTSFEDIKGHFQISSSVEEENKNFLILNKLKVIQKSIIKIDTKTSSSSPEVFLNDSNFISSYYLNTLTIDELTDKIYQSFVSNGHIDSSKVTRNNVRLHRVSTNVTLNKKIAEESDEAEIFDGEAENEAETEADAEQEFSNEINYEGETFNYNNKNSLKLSELNFNSYEKFLLEINLDSQFIEYNPNYFKFFAYKWNGLDDYLEKVKLKNNFSNDSNRLLPEEPEVSDLNSLNDSPWQLIIVPYNKKNLKIDSISNFIKKKFNLQNFNLIHYEAKSKQLNNLSATVNTSIFFNNYTRIIIENETNEAYSVLKNQYSIIKLFLNNPIDYLSESDKALALNESADPKLSFTDSDLAVLTDADTASIAAIDSNLFSNKIYGLRVSNNITLLQLKESLGSKFLLKNYNNIIIKKNNTKSSSILANNNKTLKELDISDHSFLYLEYSIKDFNSNEILLRFEVNIENLFENISPSEAKKLLRELDNTDSNNDQAGATETSENIDESDNIVSKKKNTVSYLLLDEIFFNENITIFNIKKYIFENWDTLIKNVKRRLLSLNKKFNDFNPKSPNHIRLKDLKPGKLTSPLRNDRYLSRSLFGLVNGRRLVLDILNDEEVISNNNLFFYIYLVSYNKKRIIKKNYLNIVIKKNYSLSDLFSAILKKFPFLVDEATFNSTNFNTYQVPENSDYTLPPSESDYPIDITKGFIAGPTLNFNNLNKLNWTNESNGLLNLSDGSLLIIRNKTDYKNSGSEVDGNVAQVSKSTNKSVGQGLSGIRNMIKANRLKNKDANNDNDVILVLHKEDKPPLPDNAKIEVTELPVPSPTK